jgi:hypothetical protein
MDRKRFVLLALIILAAIIAVVGVWYFTKKSVTEVRFTGVILDVSNESAYDGPIFLKVSNRDCAQCSAIWILAGGGLPPPNVQNGSVIGLELTKADIGKTVEVFAVELNPPDPNNLAISGSAKYYVKVVP